MKRESLAVAITAATLAAALLLPAAWSQPSAQEQLHSAAPVRKISVSGTGSVSARPDVAVVSIGVQTQSEEAAAALSQNSGRMQALIDALKKGGVAAGDIQTQFLNLRPRYSQPQSRQANGGPVLVGYAAINTVVVRVRKLDTLGSLLDTAVGVGGNRIDSVSFEISNSAEFLRQARDAAWQSAEAKAKQLAALADTDLGPVLSISESSRTPYPVTRGMAMEAAAVPVEPGSQSIEVTLDVTWMLQ